MPQIHRRPLHWLRQKPILRAFSPVFCYVFPQQQDLVAGRILGELSVLDDLAFQTYHGGMSVTHYSTGNITQLLDSDSVLATSETSFFIHYEKHDTTNRASALFGINVSTGDPDRCGAHAPYSDGTVYWDFGGSTEGATRLSVAGLTFGNDVWCFNTGPRGMEIWQNGHLVASNAATPTRTLSGNQLALGIHAGTGSDLVYYYSATMFNMQVPETLCRAITGNYYGTLFEESPIPYIDLNTVAAAAAAQTLHVSHSGMVWA
jgi:hypothetical protein